MSNVQFKGTASFIWTDGTTKNYKLARPLDRLRYVVRQTHYSADSLDFSARQVFTVGSAVYELIGDIRYDADSTGISQFLRAGARGLAVTYKPNSTHAGYACYMIEPTEPGLATELEDGYPAVRNKVTVRLRRTNGTIFPSTFPR
jgi:hypothetical protein